MNAVRACRTSLCAVSKLFTCKRCCHTTYTCLLAVNPLKTFRINKKSLSMMSIIEHFGDFFGGATEHYIGKNVALRWSILVGKTKA